PGTFLSTDIFRWTGGSMSGPGETTIAPGAVLEVSGARPRGITQRTLNNAGIATWIDAGPLSASDGAVINNLAGATFNVENDSTFLAFASPPNPLPAFNNAGLFRKSVGTGTGTTAIEVPLTNTGTVQVERGTLSLSGTGTSQGNFTTAAGTTLV